jgi:hypothetical protein
MGVSIRGPHLKSPLLNGEKGNIKTAAAEIEN